MAIPRLPVSASCSPSPRTTTCDRDAAADVCCLSAGTLVMVRRRLVDRSAFGMYRTRYLLASSRLVLIGQSTRAASRSLYAIAHATRSRLSTTIAFRAVWKSRLTSNTRAWGNALKRAGTENFRWHGTHLSSPGKITKRLGAQHRAHGQRRQRATSGSVPTNWSRRERSATIQYEGAYVVYNRSLSGSGMLWMARYFRHPCAVGMELWNLPPTP